MSAANSASDVVSSHDGVHADTAAPAQTSPSPLLRMPLPLLALACRWLDAQSLLATYQSCQLLSAAASHPLTFQHALRIRCEGMRGVQLSGPSATFRRADLLTAALQSRLTRHFRLLKLTSVPQPARPVEDSLEHRQVAQLLRVLHTTHDAPQLRALTVELDASKDSKKFGYTLSKQLQEQVESRTVADLSQMACTRFLKALLLHMPAELAWVFLSQPLPPSLEVIQLKLSGAMMEPKRVDDPPLPNIYALLPQDMAATVSETRLPQLRQFVLMEPGFEDCAAPEAMARSPAARMHADDGLHVVDLYTLDRVLAAAPQLHSIDLNVLSVIRRWSGLLIEVAAGRPIPRLHKVRSLHCTQYGDLFVNDGGSLLHRLFPDLEQLVFFSYQGLRDHAAECQQRLPWPPGLSSSLQSLTIVGRADAPVSDKDTTCVEQPLVDSLTRARLTSLTRLVLAGSEYSFWRQPKRTRIDDMLVSMPCLQHLTILHFRLESLQCFRHAPQLLSLRGLDWPYDSCTEPRVSVLHPNSDLSACFPRLQLLHVSHAVPSRFAARHLLCSIPTLRAVSWRTDQRYVPPSQIQALHLAAQAAAKAKSARIAAAQAAEEQAARDAYLARLLEHGIEGAPAEASWHTAQLAARIACRACGNDTTAAAAVRQRVFDEHVEKAVAAQQHAQEQAAGAATSNPFSLEAVQAAVPAVTNADAPASMGGGSFSFGAASFLSPTREAAPASSSSSGSNPFAFNSPAATSGAVFPASPFAAASPPSFLSAVPGADGPSNSAPVFGATVAGAGGSNNAPFVFSAAASSFSSEPATLPADSAANSPSAAGSDSASFFAATRKTATATRRSRGGK